METLLLHLKGLKVQLQHPSRFSKFWDDQIIPKGEHMTSKYPRLLQLARNDSQLFASQNLTTRPGERLKYDRKSTAEKG